MEDVQNGDLVVSLSVAQRLVVVLELVGPVAVYCH